MNKFVQGQTVVIGPEEGESFWQPVPSTGFITSKITPYNSPYDTFSSGIQVLEPGSSVRQHAHERSHELIFIYDGEGYAEIDGENYELQQGSMMVVGRGTQHMVFNSGKDQLKMMWVIFPPGLEDWFRAIGKLRIPGETAPEPFERPDDVTTIQHQQRFVHPKSRA